MRSVLDDGKMQEHVEQLLPKPIETHPDRRVGRQVSGECVGKQGETDGRAGSPMKGALSRPEILHLATPGLARPRPPTSQACGLERGVITTTVPHRAELLQRDGLGHEAMYHLEAVGRLNMI